MAYRKAFDETFIEGTIKTVANNGIENMRTKTVADYAGFSEATMFRRFPTKEVLLRDTFLYIDKKISVLLSQNRLLSNSGDIPFELVVRSVWHNIYRYLIENGDETLFLIRYRYSSYYTEEVRAMRQAYNGGLENAYKIFGDRIGEISGLGLKRTINNVFDITLCLVEKIVTGHMDDTEETEAVIWSAVWFTMVGGKTAAV